MCGISALYRFTSICDEDIEKLNQMNAEMKYRGPDDEGVWFDDTCGLAQVRLSIIGLEKGKQPLFNENKTLVLICNGEIYNYIELKEDLINKGHVFNSDSDSETILHLYEEHGKNCLDYLRGMFAFCLYDVNKKELFVARDRIGEKTLYFSQLPTGIVISTELKAILKSYIPEPQLNIDKLAEPIRYTSPLDKINTYIEQIKRVQPGEYLLVNTEGILKKKYWTRNLETKETSNVDQIKKKTLDLLRESVDICLRSDVPVAVMLSGGIDSSAIAALAKETGREVHTITAGYKGQFDCDEREVAKRFASEKGLIYHEIELSEEDFKNSFDDFTKYLDEPITDSAAIAQWALYKKVKNLGFKVLLGGLGGDELFFGYPYWNNLAESLSKHREHQNYFPWKGFRKKMNYLKFAFSNFKDIMFAGYPLQIHDKSISFWQYDDYMKFIVDSSLNYTGDEFFFKNLNLNFNFPENGKLHPVEDLYKFSFENIMTMAYLYLTDRLGMGNSLEIRSPFLDYKLIEYVSTIPIDILYRKDNPKFFLKEVLSDILPNYILNATKKGFTPPTTFIDEVAKSHNYELFQSKYKFYNSVLADRVLSLNLKRD